MSGGGEKKKSASLMQNSVSGIALSQIAATFGRSLICAIARTPARAQGGWGETTHNNLSHTLTNKPRSTP